MLRKVDRFKELIKSPVVAVAVSAGFIVAAYLLPQGGEDIYRAYRPFVLGYQARVFNPPHTVTLLQTHRLPLPWAWVAWTAINCAVVLVLARKMRQNPLPLLFSFPWIVQWWLGQTDIIPITGLLLLLLSEGYALRFLGAWMALVKPHIFLPAIFFRKQKEVWIAVAAAFALTLVLYGFWPLEWLSRAQGVPLDRWRWPSLLLVPVGVMLVLLFRKDTNLVIAATMLVFPSSIYTYFLLWLLPGVRGWTLMAVSWLWLLGLPFFAADAVVLCAVIPLVAIWQIWKASPLQRSRVSLPKMGLPRATVERQSIYRR